MGKINIYKGIILFCHISKTVKPKNDFSFFFESSCDFEHVNIDPESIWIQNAVCRRVRSFWLVILFRVLGGDLCKKEEHFYVLESGIVIVGLSRNRTPFTFVAHLDENNIWAKSIFTKAKSIFTKAKSYFCHISKTVKPKNDFLFSFESSCDSEHINIDPESIWIQNTVCRRVRSFD